MNIDVAVGLLDSGIKSWATSDDVEGLIGIESQSDSKQEHALSWYCGEMRGKRNDVNLQ